MRAYLPSDLPGLKQLWLDVFRDTAETVDAFHRLLPEMGNCCVETDSLGVAGAAYLIHGFTLVQPGCRSIRCGYLYAVSVREDARRRGIGEAVSQGAVQLGRDAGAEMICTLPAEASLYTWYGKILGLLERSERTRWRCDSLPSSARRLTPVEYNRRREALLSSRPHVSLNPAAIAFQALMSEAYGGGLYADDSSIFCAYRDQNAWLIPELLTDGRPDSVPFAFQPERSPYLCSDLPFPEGFLWNLTFD